MDDQGNRIKGDRILGQKTDEKLMVTGDIPYHISQETNEIKGNGNLLMPLLSLKKQ